MPEYVQQRSLEMYPKRRNAIHEYDLGARAREALERARSMPNGPERSEALKEASKLQLAADVLGIAFAKRGRPSK